MKKLLLLTSFLLIIFAAFGQDSYTASNGRVYNLGDTLKIGKGSGQSGTFVYVMADTFDAKGAPELTRKQMTYTNAIIKRIKEIKRNGSVRTIIVVNPFRHQIEIEPAIEAKEVLN